MCHPRKECFRQKAQQTQGLACVRKREGALCPECSEERRAIRAKVRQEVMKEPGL